MPSGPAAPRKAGHTGGNGSGARHAGRQANDEEARLALRRYEIRDTVESKPFQRIVDLVQHIMGVPMAP
jgi:hypothetical protein